MATWLGVTGATRFLLDVSTSSSFSSFVDGYHDVDVGNVTGRVVTGLSRGTTYYYRVRAYYGTGLTGYSETIAITTEPTTGLTIHPTFDSSITGNPNAAAIQAMINRAISVYESLFSDPITIQIRFRYATTGPDGSHLPQGTVSQSDTGLYILPWNTFVSALRADAKTNNDNVANASLPGSALSTNMRPSSANGRAVGLNTPPAMFADGTVGQGGPYDGIVTLNSSKPFQFSRPVNANSFDAQRLTEHEIDEVIGLGSHLGHNSNDLRPQDLFSWSSAGHRNTTSSGTRYFSINSGMTNIVGFNQDPGADFGDWLSEPCPQAHPYPQNAFSCVGQSSDIAASSPEGINLDVIGYDLTQTSQASLGNISTRSFVQTGEHVMIGGFIVQGSGPKRVIIRAIGPELTQFGIPDALANPRLELHNGSGALIGTNDDWQTTIIGGIITSNQVSDIQNSGHAPTAPSESAIIANLQPGNYTAIVRGVNNTLGVALVEVYDLSAGASSRRRNSGLTVLVMTKEEIAGVLEQVATLLELKAENPFKIRAYTNAARAIETFGANVSDFQDEEAVAKIPGIGKSIALKIKELAETGSLNYFRELSAEFPPGILELFSLPGLGAKKIKALHDQLGISSIAQLQKACEQGRVAELTGFGETTQQKICEAIARRASHAGSFQFGQVTVEAEALRSDLAAHEATLQVEIAGSYRRRKEIVHDLDLLAATTEPEAVTKFFVSHPLVESVIAQGPTKTSVRLRSGVQCDLRVVTTVEYPFALAYFTGNKEHNIEMRSRALQRGWTLNEYRLAPVPDSEMVGSADRAVGNKKKKKSPGKIPDVRNEADLYHAVDLDFIPPELRENCGEFEAAKQHSLPKLIEKENLRGTFHCHTVASDGHNTLEEMAEAARELGLEYLGIADHSRSSVQGHGIPAEKLFEQVAAIQKLNKAFEGFRLFAGVECDILRDGSLDFSDEVLSQLDYVVASVHSAFNLSESEMTQRVIRALENPFVTMLAHPTGRLLLKRDPYRIDIPAVLDAAARTGTWIELNAAPKRLDLDWRWWPLAKQKGVKCVINPDAHRTERLQDLWFGIGIARKGWLTREDVVNCSPLSKIEQALRAKRKVA